MVLGCDVYNVLSCVSGLRVCTCTSLMASGGRRGAITHLLITSHDLYFLVYSVFCSRQVLFCLVSFFRRVVRVTHEGYGR